MDEFGALLIHSVKFGDVIEHHKCNAIADEAILMFSFFISKMGWSAESERNAYICDLLTLK